MYAAGVPDVSRETQDKLEAYVALLEKWNPKINLVSRASLEHLWDRHIADSIQVFEVAPHASLWADLGSGGGFPGLVLAILAETRDVDRKTILVESDQRKCAFLRTVSRELELNVEVIAERIERIEPLGADVISARALSELPVLLEYCSRHLAPDGTAVFPKGRTWMTEVETARQSYKFALDIHPSRTEPGAAILHIRDLQRV